MRGPLDKRMCIGGVPEGRRPPAAWHHDQWSVASIRGRHPACAPVAAQAVAACNRATMRHLRRLSPDLGGRALVLGRTALDGSLSSSASEARRRFSNARCLGSWKAHFCVFSYRLPGLPIDCRLSAPSYRTYARGAVLIFPPKSPWPALGSP